jgi:hypothetical protein
MPFKVFVNNTTLPDTDLNDYLMEQAVIRCTSGTRPSSPNDGMTIYETDTGMHRYYRAASTDWRHVISNAPHVLLTKTATAITNNSITTVSWTSALKNEHSMWVSGSDITIPYAGVYVVHAVVRWASQATVVGMRQVRINVGGSEQNYYALAPTTALNATNVVTALSHPMSMNAADTITISVYQNSGGSLDIIGPTRVLVSMVSED